MQRHRPVWAIKTAQSCVSVAVVVALGMAKKERDLPSLVQLCLQAAAACEYWRVQRRQLACLPEEAANELLRLLLEQRRITPPQLELFRHSVTAVGLSGPGISATWLACLGAFWALRQLRLHRCPRLRGEHLQHLAPLAPTLQLLDVSGCTGLTAGAAQHLAQLVSLQALYVSATGLDGPAVASLAAQLTQLTALELEGLPAVSDDTCRALGSRLPRLQRLVLAGCAVGEGGMRGLEDLQQLTALDVSLTGVHSPPMLTTLRQLSMAHCCLGLAEGSAQEAIWLHLGAALPLLRELQLAGTSLLPPHGERLLQGLVAGAAGSLRHLNLCGSSFSGNLSMLASTSALTWLDLSVTPVADQQLCHLALAPLSWLSLSKTAVGDEGLAHLLPLMTSLHYLDISETRVGNGSWRALAQLQLGWLDLSGTRVTGSSLPEGLLFPFPCLTSLHLLNSSLSSRGCCALAAALPALLQLRLGSKEVDDKGLRALCSLPKLQELHLQGCAVSDPGLRSALPRCPTLRRLVLHNCWLASAAGLEAAAAAAVQAGGQLAEVVQEGVTLLHRSPAAGSRRETADGAGFTRGTAAAAAGASTPGSGRRGSSGAGSVLMAEVLAHDERLAYSLDELLNLRAAVAPVADVPPQPMPSSAAGTGATSSQAIDWQQNIRQLRQSLPPDLRT